MGSSKSVNSKDFLIAQQLSKSPKQMTEKWVKTSTRTYPKLKEVDVFPPVSQIWLNRSPNNL
jgi:hypothetical protein